MWEPARREDATNKLEISKMGSPGKNESEALNKENDEVRHLCTEQARQIAELQAQMQLLQEALQQQQQQQRQQQRQPPPPPPEQQRQVDPQQQQLQEERVSLQVR
ncbi:hypothetical protein PV326_012824, partial [Microctonus aethiopoides]